MIYQIIHDRKNYLTYTIPVNEVINKLGRSRPFHIDVSPIAYSDIWKEPLTIELGIADIGCGTELGDIAEIDGRLFLSEKAYKCLKEILENDGEFLPVNYKEGKGYIFNPLKTAEELNAIDKKITIRNTFGDLIGLGFIEEKMNSVIIFKTKEDSHTSSYCNEKLKLAIEKEKLTGIIFNIDLYTPVNEFNTNKQ